MVTAKKFPNLVANWSDILIYISNVFSFFIFYPLFQSLNHSLLDLLILMNFVPSWVWCRDCGKIISLIGSNISRKQENYPQENNWFSRQADLSATQIHMIEYTNVRMNCEWNPISDIILSPAGLKRSMRKSAMTSRSNLKTFQSVRSYTMCVHACFLVDFG